MSLDNLYAIGNTLYHYDQLPPEAFEPDAIEYIYIEPAALPYGDKQTLIFDNEFQTYEIIEETFKQGVFSSIKFGPIDDIDEHLVEIARETVGLP